jgi:hypothetical protein
VDSSGALFFSEILSKMTFPGAAFVANNGTCVSHGVFGTAWDKRVSEFHDSSRVIDANNRVAETNEAKEL